jgi:hypothetical protein
MSTMDSVSVPSAPPREQRTASGWVVFAGVMLLIIGSLDALYGLAAVLNDEVVIVGGHGVIVADVSTWGWVHLVIGSCVALTGIGLFASWAMARWTAVCFVAVNAIAQIVWFPAAPLWACLMIALDVVVIYQLTVRWEQ